MSDLRCRAMTHRPVQMHSLHAAMQPVEKVLMTVKAKESLPLLGPRPWGHSPKSLCFRRELRTKVKHA